LHLGQLFAAFILYFHLFRVRKSLEIIGRSLDMPDAVPVAQATDQSIEGNAEQ